MRSRIWFDWTVTVMIVRSSRGPALPVHDLYRDRARKCSRLFDADQLRFADDDAVALDLIDGAAHCILGGRIGDKDDRDRRRVGGIFAAVRAPAGMTLHDRF